MNHMGHTEKINIENYQSAPGRNVLNDMHDILRYKGLTYLI